MAGNILGRRSYYAYEADDGNTYSLLLDDTNAAAAGLTLDAANPAPPRRFKPRVVFVERNIGERYARKELVIGDVTAALYATSTTQSVDIDGLAFFTTGRRGEKISFPRNNDPVDIADQDTAV